MRPNIFQYEDYRTYLRDLYQYLKKTKPAFSYRYFARKAGFSSPNFLKLVIENQRNLAAESIPRFAKALQLNQQESEFLACLVHFNQAKDPGDKALHYKSMMRCRRYREIHQIEKEVFKFYSKWYYVAIRELVALKEFREDPQWIARRLTPRITQKQAAQAIQTLLKLKLLTRDQQGRLKQADPIIATEPEVKSLAVTKFHKDMLKLASRSLDEMHPGERDVTASTVGVASEQVPMVKRMIERFRKELLTTIETSGKEPGQVYQLNVQFFPISVTEEES